MVNLTINGQAVTVPQGTTILEAAATAGISIPHLCYLKGINEIAACRVCCVEVEGEHAMVTACNNPVKEGMVVHTNSPRVRTTRRINVELILSQHDCKCATCVRSGNCQLQTIANDLGIVKVHYETQLPRGLRGAWTTTFPLYHDYNKCIKCMRCIQVCDKVQTLSIWDVSGTGGRTMIDVSGNRVMKDSDCALCGQCITHCPTGGLRERDDTMEVFSALADPDKITVVQVAPAVRTAWGEAFGLPREQATMERMAAALRRLGFDYVWEIGWTQDTLAYFAAPFGGRSALFRQLCGSFGPFGAVQGINALGGFKVQGKTADSARKLLEDAHAVEEAGAFAVVLEAIPAELAERVSAELTIPTIGIGAGAGCDGPVLVNQDMLGMFHDFTPKFVRRFAEVGDVMLDAYRAYDAAVKDGTFPAAEHTYAAPAGVLETL